MFSQLHALGCSYQNLEKSLCSNTIVGFRSNLISYYPNLYQQITGIVQDPDQSIPGNITFMTYNLYTNQEYAKNARMIACTNADVVAVQEVRGAGYFDVLKNKSGLNGEMCVTIDYVVYKYGIGLLWKPSLGTPIISTEIFHHVNSSEEDRALIFAEFNNFCFIATHYGGDPDQNTNMSNSVIAYAKSVNKPVYIAGDFNAEPGSPTIVNLTNNNFVVLNDLNVKTTPSNNPVSLKDMIIGYNNNSTQHNIISRGVPVFPREDLRDLSDHLPYCVTVKL
jgi:endonuclease/exonuclease/phosphatase family metal-dependent hydrolase